MTVSLAAGLTRSMFGPAECVTDCSTVDNPFQPAVLQPYISALEVIGSVGLLIGLLAGAASLFWRFHRAGGVERQQVKWFAAAVGLGFGLLLVQIPMDVVWSANDWISGGAFAVALVLPAAAIAVAVLRFRLYDLGRVVSRTVSYAVITALLVGVYSVLVTASTRVLPAVRRSPSPRPRWPRPRCSSPFAAAFRQSWTEVQPRPLRRRPDGRSLHKNVRGEVDLDAVSSDLIAAVHDTLEPARVGLWLRPRQDSS